MKRPRRVESASCDSSSESERACKKTKPTLEWPAPADAIAVARAFLIQCASSSSKTLIVPDKDADGLSAGAIMHRTLVALGHAPDRLFVHLLGKGTNPHSEVERKRMGEYNPEYAVVLDHGSRGGAAIIPPRADGRKVKTLLVDHHLSDGFPEDTLVLSACNNPPIATSAALAYDLCLPLHPSVQEQCGYLCAIGTHGDLGTSFKWAPPFPDMSTCFKKHTKKAVNEAVSLVNAPRRTALFDVSSAWEALITSTSPSSLLTHPRLLAARREISTEITRCAHTRPAFSADGRTALVRISSAAQVHPVIATRWAGSLKAAKLQIVIAANDAYQPGMTNFACRVARCAIARASSAGTGGAKKSTQAGRRDAFAAFKSVQPSQAESTEAKTPALADQLEEISIPALLRAYAARQPGLADELGADFARGHAHASGGIVSHAAFEKLWAVINEEGPASEGGRAKEKGTKRQLNTLEGWVKRSGA